MLNPSQKTSLLLSIGSNLHANFNIPIALERIEQEFNILACSLPLITQPINFPYPSSFFTNLLIYAETSKNLEAIALWSKSIEIEAGRTEQSKVEHPELISIDIDIVLWGERLIRPQDLQRYYVPSAFESMNLQLVNKGEEYFLKKSRL